MKREAFLKAALMCTLKDLWPECQVLQHSTAAAPDRSLTANGRTTLWEFKHGTPDFVSLGDQELMCMRLAVQGYCRYVIWQEREGEQWTLIVHPREVHARVGWLIIPELAVTGFNHRWLVEQIKQVHQCL